MDDECPNYSVILEMANGLEEEYDLESRIPRYSSSSPELIEFAAENGLTNDIQINVEVAAFYEYSYDDWDYLDEDDDYGTPSDITLPYAPGTPTHSDSDTDSDGVSPHAGFDDDTSLYFSWMLCS